MHSFFLAFTFLTNVRRKYMKFIKILRCVRYNNKVRTKADGNVVFQV